MNKIPTQIDNPTGLHGKYFIQKIKPHPNAGQLKSETKWGERYYPDFILRPVDPNSEYFVMRLDEGGKDPEHIKACRIGVHAYADAIQHHLPELAKDLKERYPLIN